MSDKAAPTFDLTFDIPESGDTSQGMWLVITQSPGNFSTEEEATEEANRRNKALGWSGEWIGEVSDV